MKLSIAFLALCLLCSCAQEPERSPLQGPQRYRVTTIYGTWENVTKMESPDYYLYKYGYVGFYNGDTLVRVSGSVMVEEMP